MMGFELQWSNFLKSRLPIYVITIIFLSSLVTISLMHRHTTQDAEEQLTFFNINDFSMLFPSAIYSKNVAPMLSLRKRRCVNLQDKNYARIKKILKRWRHTCNKYINCSQTRLPHKNRVKRRIFSEKGYGKNKKYRNNNVIACMTFYRVSCFRSQRKHNVFDAIRHLIKLLSQVIFCVMTIFSTCVLLFTS